MSQHQEAQSGEPKEGRVEPSSQRLSRRLRRRLRPLHPNRLRAQALHLAHRLGWFQLRLWLGGLAPRRLWLSTRWWFDQKNRCRGRRRERRLTVAVDISPFWHSMTGIGWYLHRLLEALADRDDVRLRLYGPDWVTAGEVDGTVTDDGTVADEAKKEPHRPPLGPALEVVTYKVPTEFSIVGPVFADWMRRRAARWIAADGNDVLFAPNYLLPPAFDGLPGARVSVVHDLSPWVVPETMRESTRDQLRMGLEVALRASERVITDSHAVRGELERSGLVDPTRVDVVPLAPALFTEGDFTEGELTSNGGALEPALPESYILFVGTLEPRKNLAMLIDAFERYRETSGDMQTQLVVCGGVGWKAETLVERIGRAEQAGFVRYEGYANDERLLRLYQGAQWLALPSLYEGFGLPAAEAMAADVPLLLADIEVLREVGGEAALYASADDVEAWRALLTQALCSPSLRSDLAEKAKRRARRFSWQRTADATVATWRLAASRSTRGGGA